jgi:Tripartite tricarboxylate transporter TctB family
MRISKDLLAGLIFLGFGVLAIVVARSYPMGSAMRMGPGYFPTMLGGILVFFGLVLVVRGIRVREALALEWGWKPVAFIGAAMLAFGALLPRFGFAPAVAVLLVVAALGGREFRWKEVLALAAGMTVFAIVVFLYLLKLPYPWISFRI